MQRLTGQLRDFDNRNITGVEDLVRLDTCKSNMTRCRDMLKEHARWSQLVREAKAVVDGLGGAEGRAMGRFSEAADG